MTANANNDENINRHLKLCQSMSSLPSSKSMKTSSSQSPPLDPAAKRPSLSWRLKAKSERLTFPSPWQHYAQYRSSSSSFSTSSNTSLLNTDDFVFNAMHPNYQKMMNDNHLIDRCAEVEREIDENPVLRECIKNIPKYLTKNTTVDFNDAPVDGDKLMAWVQHMSKYINRVTPTCLEVSQMDPLERNRLLKEHYDLRLHIASYDSIVKRFVKEAKNEYVENTISLLCNNVEENYLMLLLQAVEAQCLFEGYPLLRDSNCPKGYNSPETTDNDEEIHYNDIYKLCDMDSVSFDPQLDKHSDYASGDISSGDVLFTSTDSICDKSKQFNEEFPIEIELKSQCDEMKLLPSTWKLVENVEQLVMETSTSNSELIDKIDEWLIQQTVPDTTSQEEPPNSLSASSYSVGSELELPSIRATTSIIDQSWDNFQEVYGLTTSGCNFGDLNIAEQFLNFGESYGDLLGTASNLSLPKVAGRNCSLSSIPDTQLNVLNIHANRLEDSFLLTESQKFQKNAQRKSLGDLFKISEDFPYNEWSQDFCPRNVVEGRKSWCGVYEPQRNLPLLTLQKNARKIEFGKKAPMKNIASQDSIIENLIPIKEVLVNGHHQCKQAYNLTVENILNEPQINGTEAQLSNDVQHINRTVDEEMSHLSAEQKRHIFKKSLEPRFCHRPDTSNSPMHTEKLKNKALNILKKPMHSLSLEDFNVISKVCHTNMSCVCNILAGENLTNFQLGSIHCQDDDTSINTCSCDIIACFLWRALDFLIDVTNMIRHTVIYKYFAGMINEFYSMVKFFTSRVGMYRRFDQTNKLLL